MKRNRRPNRILTLAVMTIFLLSLVGIRQTFAQGTLRGIIRDKVKEKVIEEVQESVDEQSEDEQTEEEQTDEQKSESTDESEQNVQKATPVKQKVEAKSQYDFVAGDKLLFFEDFSQDAVGDFPALWTTTGSGEVKTLNIAPGNWLHLNARDQVYILMKELNLPENFIFEFDVVAQSQDEDGHCRFYFTLYNSTGDFLDDDLFPGEGGVHVTLRQEGWDVQSYSNVKEQMPDGTSEMNPIVSDALNHVIVWVQKSRMRIYHKGQKVVDLPTVMYTPTHFNRLRFSLWGNEGNPLISNLRFTTASPDTRSKLLTEGKLISYGIYFDVNSDKIKAESRGAVNDIAKVLNENPQVRIRIDGHTDSDGDNAKNLDLSKRRAASVKNMLVSEFKVAADRIETDGLGETKPIESNTTSEGKARNRRVEFIKL